jgi:pilus assembly protein CpaF
MSLRERLSLADDGRSSNGPPGLAAAAYQELKRACTRLSWTASTSNA